MFNLTYQGKSFNQRESDNYVNLGQLCSIHGKRLQNWSQLKSAIAYIEAVSANTGIPVLELIITKQGNEGTWGHPLIAIEVARWISPEFGVWCNQHIKQLVETGKTELAVNELELVKAQTDYLKLKAIATKAELALLQKRQDIVTMLPEPLQQKVLGYQEIKTVEYRDRIIHNEDIIRDGSTLNKTELCKRYGFLTAKGKPNYTQLNKWLQQFNLPSDAWKLTASIRENQELHSDYLPQLDQQWRNGGRQMYFNESEE